MQESTAILSWLWFRGLLSCILLTFSAAISFAQLSPGAYWAKFHHDLHNSGNGATSGAGPVLKWRFGTNGPIDSSPAMGVDGTIYIGSTDGSLYAVDGSRGLKKWSFATGSAITSSPAIGADGTIFVGSLDGNLYAVNAATGLKKWSLATGGPVESSPTVGPDGTVYFGSDDNYLYAVAGSTGTLKWRFATGDAIDSSPAIGSDGMIYIGSEDSFLYSIDPAGVENWSFATMGSIESAPLFVTSASTGLADNMVFVGSDDTNVYAIESSSGTELWAFATIGPVTSTPISNGPFLGVASGYEDAQSLVTFGAVYQIYMPTGNGSETIFPGQIVSSPGLADNFYVGMLTGFDAHSNVVPPAMLAINWGNLSENWAFQTVGSGYIGDIRSSPALGPDSTVYFGSEDGYLYAIGDSTIFYANPNVITGGTATQGIIQLPAPAASGGVGYSISCPSGLLQTLSAAVAVPSGSAGAQFPISSSVVSVPTVVPIAVSSAGSSAQTYVTLNPYLLSGISTSAGSITGGTPLSGLISLLGPAGPSGNVISVKSSTPSVQVPAFVSVPAGQTSGPFTIRTVPVAATVTAVITATFEQSSVQTTLTVAPSLNFYTSPASVCSAPTFSGVIQLGVAAPAGGALISLSANSSAVTLPSLITVPAGIVGVSFQAKAVPVSANHTVTLTATYGAAIAHTVITITPALLTNFYVSPNMLTGGHSTSGVIQLTKDPVVGENVVSLSSSSSDVTVPSSVTVPTTSTGVSFLVSTALASSIETVTLTASLGSATKQTTITLDPYPLSNFFVSSSAFVGGQSVNGVAQLAGKAGASGNLIVLTCSSPIYLGPGQVKVPSGATGVSFPVKTAAVTIYTYRVASKQNLTER